MLAEARELMGAARGWASDLLRAAAELLPPERPTGTVWGEVGDDLRQAMRDYPLSEAAKDAGNIDLARTRTHIYGTR